MKNGDIYELNNISLILKEINLSVKQLDRLKIELLQDNVLLDETLDISAKYNEKQKTLKLEIGSATFKYKKSDLFSFHKVAKILVKLYRMNSFGTDQQLIQEYKLTLSQYAYEYCRSITSTVNEHVVGLMKKSFFYYTVHCTYQDRANKQNQSQNKLIKIPKLKKGNLQLSQSFQPLKQRDYSTLPLDSIPYNYRPMKKKENVFISYEKLVPIYASEKLNEDKLFKIKLQHSHINVDDIKEDSVLSQTQKLQQSAQNFKQWLFYIFIVLAVVQIFFLMSPKTKIR